jgi:flagellar basal-body rod protein FlgF/flagellar basal-body rod protein FlgG
MDSGYYAACTGLVVRTQALDTIANNLANTSTPGFRGNKNVFHSLVTENEKLSILNADANDYGVLSGTRLDTTQGALTSTANPLDFAIEGSGYFQVQTASGVAYTRGGSFRISPQGQLTTAGGDPVIGDNGPISVPGSPVSVSPDGTITANGAIAGRLRVVDFPKDTQVESLGGGYYRPTQATTPTNSTMSQIHQGMLESSNVNPVTSVIELISAQREVESMRRVLTMFNNELDKTAAQDLPRVG